MSYKDEVRVGGREQASAKRGGRGGRVVMHTGWRGHCGNNRTHGILTQVKLGLSYQSIAEYR